jgi:hypothetical protein
MCRRVSDTAAGEQSGIACTDAERRAALALAEELRDQGREPRVQTLWVHVAWWAPQALAAALGIAASVVGVGTPVAGLSLAGAALLIALLDLLPAAPLRRIIPARATQNVVSAPAAGPDVPVTLILTAAVDRARGGLVRRFPGGVLRWSLAALVLVLACCVVRALETEAGWVGAVQLGPTLVLLGCLLALLDQAVAEPAARDDRGAVAAVLTVTAELDAAPPANLGVAVVLAGAGGAQAAGLRAWLRSRRRRGLTGADVALVHLEPTPGDPPSYWARDGLVLSGRLHPQLVRAARAAAAAAPQLEARERRRIAGTAAASARSARWPAVAVGIGDGADGVAFTLALVRALDAELGAAAPDGGS